VLIGFSQQVVLIIIGCEINKVVRIELVLVKVVLIELAQYMYKKNFFRCQEKKVLSGAGLEPQASNPSLPTYLYTMEALESIGLNFPYMPGSCFLAQKL
jgi:hypothetical protein